MREIVYYFHRRGCYQTDSNTCFGDDTELKLIIREHSFSLAVGGETLRTSSCKGYQISVLHTGEAAFYDSNNRLLARADGQDRTFSEVRFLWEQDLLTLQLGQMVTVDNYPDCDGEYDRWEEKWKPEYEVRFSETTGKIETSAR